jgi:hypothetical protein
MNNNVKNMETIGVFAKGLSGVDCKAFEFNRDGFPLDYVKDVLSAVSGYVARAKASGHKTAVEFNMAMYRPVGSLLNSAHVRLVVSNVGGSECNCHSVAYLKVDGVSKRIESQTFKLEDVILYLESIEQNKTAQLQSLDMAEFCAPMCR